MYPSVDRDTKTTQIYHALNLQMTNILVAHPPQHCLLSHLSFQIVRPQIPTYLLCLITQYTGTQYWPAASPVTGQPCQVSASSFETILSQSCHHHPAPAAAWTQVTVSIRDGNETLPRLKFHNQTIPITEMAPTRDFSGLKVPTNAFTFLPITPCYSKPIVYVNRSEFGMLTQRL